MLNPLATYKMMEGRTSEFLLLSLKQEQKAAVKDTY